MIAFFRDLGGEPTPVIDPAEIVRAPVERRITISPRLDPLPRAKGAVPAKASIVDAINGLVAVLAPRPSADPLPQPAPAQAARPLPLSPFRRDEPDPPPRPMFPPTSAREPQVIDAMPLGPPPEPFSEPRGPRCRWPHTDTPGASSGACEQLAAPGLPYCALHWVQHVRQRQRFG